MTYDPESECDLNRLSDIRVYYRGNSEASVRVVVTNVDSGNVVLDRQVTANDSLVFEDPIKAEGQYRVEVRVAGGPSADYVWEVGEAEARTDSRGLQVSIGSDEIEFTEIVN